MEAEWIAILVPGFFFAMIVLVVYFVGLHRSRLRATELQLDAQSRMLDRFGSSPDFVNFLQSTAGQQLVKGFGEVPRSVAHDRILGGVNKGIVLSFLGAGFLAVCLFEQVRNAGLLIFGFVFLGLGIGYLVSTIVSIRLSKTWGLLPKPGESGVSEPSGNDLSSTRP